MKVVEENNKTRVGGDRHEVFSRETPHHCGKFRHHATVEGPQNWALVWALGSRALESKVLENSNTMQLWRSTSEVGNRHGYLQPTLVVKKLM